MLERLLAQVLHRRTLLTGMMRAGLISAAGLPALAKALTPEVREAPRGLVSETFKPLGAFLLALDAWRPYPVAGDPAWASVPRLVREAILARADVVNTTPLPAMLATDELEFARNGNRSRFETITFGRRNRLGDLVLAECVTSTGKYLDQIANGVWLICEESFWGVPAHLGAQRTGVGLADEAEPIIELFGAETAATLAWVVYLLGPRLDTVSPRIVERVHLETTRRILDPYSIRDDFSWMGLNGKPHRLNNWNVWINSNVLTANLLLERDPQRRQAMVERICRSVDGFLADYSPDAGCEEGPGYWARSAGSFFDCCSTLVSAHGGRGSSVLTHPFTRAMGHYICDVHIADDFYVDYGDASPRDAPPPDLAFRFGRATGDSVLAAFGALGAKERGTGTTGASLREAIVAHRGGVASLSRALATVTVASAIAPAPAHDALPRDAWYPSLGLMTARQTEGSSEGFYLASQAASNGRSHGHNDSGSFILFHHGQPVFIDVGPEAYTARTFSKDRYTLWTMQSAYHNLPTIGGVMQHEGEPYRASDLVYRSTDAEASFRGNLGTAYPKQAGVQRWTRTLTLNRQGGEVTLLEDFVLDRPVDILLSLMTAAQPVLRADGVKVGTAMLHFDRQSLKPSVERIAITDEAMKHSWGDTVYRLKLNSATPVARGTWKLSLQSA